MSRDRGQGTGYLGVAGLQQFTSCSCGSVQSKKKTGRRRYHSQRTGTLVDEYCSRLLFEKTVTNPAVLRVAGFLFYALADKSGREVASIKKSAIGKFLPAVASSAFGEAKRKRRWFQRAFILNRSVVWWSHEVSVQNVSRLYAIPHCDDRDRQNAQRKCKQFKHFSLAHGRSRSPRDRLT